MTRIAPVPPAVLVLVVLLVATACGPRFREQVYRSGPIAFRVGELPGDWRRVRLRGSALAFHHARGGTIVASASCGDIDDVPLDVLTSHLLFGVEERRELGRETTTLDGRAALRTRVDGKVDGVPVTLDLVVTRKDECLYDLQLIAGRAAFAERRPDFDRFIAGFGRVR